MLPNLIFSNEKLFTVEAAFNHRNDRVLSKSLQDIPSGLKKVRRTQNPALVMVWAAASSDGKSPLIFIPKGIKINKKVYIDKILKDGLMPWTVGCIQMQIGPFNKMEQLLIQPTSPNSGAGATVLYS